MKVFSYERREAKSEVSFTSTALVPGRHASVFPLNSSIEDSQIREWNQTDASEKESKGNSHSCTVLTAAKQREIFIFVNGSTQLQSCFDLRDAHSGGYYNNRRCKWGPPQTSDPEMDAHRIAMQRLHSRMLSRGRVRTGLRDPRPCWQPQGKSATARCRGTPCLAPGAVLHTTIASPELRPTLTTVAAVALQGAVLAFLMEIAMGSKTFTNKKVNVVLDEMNFLLWKQQILLTIRSHRLERLLTGAAVTPPETVVDEDGTVRINEEYEDFVAQDSALASWLLSTISPHLLSQFVGAETATTVWNTVLHFFANRSTTTVMSLHYKLHSLKKGGDSMRAYLTRVKEVCDALASCGSTVPQVEQIASILKGLPREYQPFMAIITSMRDTLSLDSISTMLIDAETQLASFDDQLETLPMSANIAQGEVRNTSNNPNQRSNYSYSLRTNGRGRGRYRVQCQLCGKIGHLVDRCWHRFNKDFSCVSSVQQDQYQSEYKVVHPSNSFTSSSADDGCECCAMKRNGSAASDQPQVHTASMQSERWVVDTGATHHVTADANKVMNSSEYRGPGKLLIGNGMPLDVALVGHAQVNTSSRVLFLNNLLHVPQITKNLLSVSKLAKDNDVFIEFHANRCCIRDEATGTLLLQGEETDGLYSFVMDEPLEANIAQTNNSLDSTRLDELWHRRLGHPAAETLSKIASAIDAYTRHTWIYLLKHKDEAYLAFQLFQKLISNQLTCPHTSEQNGVVERKHRHIVELALVLLAQASLPIKYWSYAVTSVVHLINHLPTKVLQDMSPFEKLFGKKPEYSMMKTFGCQCFPHLRMFQKHKLSFRSQECTYLGISPQHKGFQCLAPDGRVYVSRHVVFNESIFPFVGKGSCTSLDPAVNPNAQTLRIITTFRNSCCPAPSNLTNTTNMHEEDNGTEAPNALEIDIDETQHVPDDVVQHASDATISTETAPDTAADMSADVESVPANDTQGNIPESDDDAPTVSESAGTPQTRVHHMMTRSRCGVFKPKVFSSIMDDDDVPNTIDAALQSPHWAAAVHEEYKALTNNGTWTLVRLPKDRMVVGCKWLFRVKRNPDGSVNRYKARLVAKGFSQVPGQDFKDTFSPVVRFSTFNTVLAVAVSNGWEIRHIDINNAFLNGDLSEEVFMQQPPGFEQEDECNRPLVCKLKKALYGLRQAPRNWHAKLKENLMQMGFVVSRADSSLFIQQNDGNYTYALVYVDDIVITGQNSSAIENVVSMLQSRFSLKDLGVLSFFLGIEVKHRNNSVVLSQKKYILELLEKTGMLNAASCATPMVVSPKLSHEEGELIQNASEYRSIVGSLLYICHTRPDISFGVGQVAQHMHAPRETHFVAVKRILRYLSTTLNFGLSFSRAGNSLDITAFADADWGASIDDRRSITGYGVFLGKCLITWCSKKQRTVSRSTMEAEYKSVADTAADITWVQALLSDLGIHQSHKPVIWCDNTSAVAMSANPVYHAQSKHVDLDVHFVREKVAADQLNVSYVPAMHQIADGFTKPLARTAFEEFRSKICVQQV
ncbi:hypothetical protein F3Y22_tig00110348pilonHSYRG00083 [Hibiscus syriacus]|uniref:Integrase catalytic domain-containing protein n=1 Tax=Hibiscus syriacus TaxID=106335 RepID=A0A6A3AWP1_HIBSY|nr:hypothetical protein F3Y22_tig00110348pilonHSYRG00083 [Hibiscus syriacus]